MRLIVLPCILVILACGLWSSDAEDAEFVEAMNASFVDVRAERVEFEYPGRPDPVFNIIYLGRRA